MTNNREALEAFERIVSKLPNKGLCMEVIIQEDARAVRQALQAEPVAVDDCPYSLEEMQEALDVIRLDHKEEEICECISGACEFALEKYLATTGAISGWRDIETAPRDGTQVIVNAPQLESESTYAYFKNGHWHLAYDGKKFGIHVKQPTHWMPLPQPPTDCRNDISTACQSEAFTEGGEREN